MEGKSSKGGSKHIVLQIIALFTFTAVFSVILFSSNNRAAASTQKVGVTVTAKDTLQYGISTDNAKEIFNPKIVSIKRGRYVSKVLTNKTDILEILKDNNILLDKKERVICDTQGIRDNSVISIIRSETVVEYENIEIPFATQTIKTNKYAKGEKIIVQKGINGLKVQKKVTYYEDGELVKTTVLEERTKISPVTQIVEVGTALYSLTSVDPKGYNCNYWYSVVDSAPYTAKEKDWLKFVMYCESGCNAESNKGYYKGLFQWSPSVWSKLYKENIFDGHAQIKHTIEKYRAGGANMWPACNRSYNN